MARDVDLCQPDRRLTMTNDSHAQHLFMADTSAIVNIDLKTFMATEALNPYRTLLAPTTTVPRAAHSQVHFWAYLHRESKPLGTNAFIMSSSDDLHQPQDAETGIMQSTEHQGSESRVEVTNTEQEANPSGHGASNPLKKRRRSDQSEDAMSIDDEDARYGKQPEILGSLNSTESTETKATDENPAEPSTQTPLPSSTIAQLENMDLDDSDSELTEPDGYLTVEEVPDHAYEYRFHTPELGYVHLMDGTPVWYISDYGKTADAEDAADALVMYQLTTIRPRDMASSLEAEGARWVLRIYDFVLQNLTDDFNTHESEGCLPGDVNPYQDLLPHIRNVRNKIRTAINQHPEEAKVMAAIHTAIVQTKTITGKKMKLRQKLKDAVLVEDALQDPDFADIDPYRLRATKRLVRELLEALDWLKGFRQWPDVIHTVDITDSFLDAVN